MTVTESSPSIQQRMGFEHVFERLQIIIDVQRICQDKVNYNTLLNFGHFSRTKDKTFESKQIALQTMAQASFDGLELRLLDHSTVLTVAEQAHILRAVGYYLLPERIDKRQVPKISSSLPALWVGSVCGM